MMPSAHALLETLRDLLSALAQLAIAWMIPVLFALLVLIVAGGTAAVVYFALPYFT